MKKKPKFKIPFLAKIFNAVPGKKKFGVYRFLPFFFVLGASLEFSMINWSVGEANFYNVYKKNQAKYIIENKEAEKNI